MQYLFSLCELIDVSLGVVIWPYNQEERRSEFEYFSTILSGCTSLVELNGAHSCFSVCTHANMTMSSPFVTILVLLGPFLRLNLELHLGARTVAWPSHFRTGFDTTPNIPLEFSAAACNIVGTSSTEIA